MQLATVYEDRDVVHSEEAYENIERPTELRGPIYEEPEDIKPHPTTQDNVAYGHVQIR